MDKSRVEPTIFFKVKISFSLKLFSGLFYGQSFIKTVRGPLHVIFLFLFSAVISLKNTTTANITARLSLPRDREIHYGVRLVHV